jgi:hypothetical protein
MGDVVLVATGITIFTSVIGSVVDAGVNSVVVTTVGTVVGEVVTASVTGVWVHPMKQTNAIKRITTPIYFFMAVNYFCSLIIFTPQILIILSFEGQLSL